MSKPVKFDLNYKIFGKSQAKMSKLYQTFQ